MPTQRPQREHEPGYAGVGLTYCRAPYLADLAEAGDHDVVVLGAAFDEGVSYRPGTRFGPRAIRLAEDMGAPSERPHMELGVDPFAELSIVDHGDVAVVAADLRASHAALHTAVTAVLAAAAVPVVLGGDHSISGVMLRALAERFGPDGYAVVHFDTHADTGADVQGVRLSHGTPFHWAIEDGRLRGDHLVQLGLRGAWPTPPEFAWMRERGIHWITMREMERTGIHRAVEQAISHAARRAPRIYLTVDVDVLDPAFAPGTGTPEPGGMTTRELLTAVSDVAAGADVAAMDVVEVSPPYDVADVTALAAHRVVLEALSGIALRRSGRQPRPERPA